MADAGEQEEEVDDGDDDGDMHARCKEHYPISSVRLSPFLRWSVVQLLPQVINEGAEKGTEERAQRGRTDGRTDGRFMHLT